MVSSLQTGTNKQYLCTGTVYRYRGDFIKKPRYNHVRDQLIRKAYQTQLLRINLDHDKSLNIRSLLDYYTREDLLLLVVRQEKPIILEPQYNHSYQKMRMEFLRDNIEPLCGILRLQAYLRLDGWLDEALVIEQYFIKLYYELSCLTLS
jgi:hypothetical protein